MHEYEKEVCTWKCATAWTPILPAMQCEVCVESDRIGRIPHLCGYSQKRPIPFNPINESDSVQLFETLSANLLQERIASEWKLSPVAKNRSVMLKRSREEIDPTTSPKWTSNSLNAASSIRIEILNSRFWSSSALNFWNTLWQIHLSNAYGSTGAPMSFVVFFWALDLLLPRMHQKWMLQHPLFHPPFYF